MFHGELRCAVSIAVRDVEPVSNLVDGSYVNVAEPFASLHSPPPPPPPVRHNNACDAAAHARPKERLRRIEQTDGQMDRWADRQTDLKT